MIKRWLQLETNERKNLALLMMFGGAIIFTAMAFVGFWWLKDIPNMVFLLALVAHVQIFSILAGFIAQLVKRRVKATRHGIEITDEGIVIKEEPRRQYREEHYESEQGRYSDY